MSMCGTCGQSGHNSRTCPDKKEKGSKPPVKIKKTTGRTCGNCGEKGHNRRSCSKATKEEEEEEHIEITCDHNWQPKKEKKVVKCSLCGERDDHTAKNCPYQPLPEGTKLGPTLMECGHFSWWKEKEVCTKCSVKRRFQTKQA